MNNLIKEQINDLELDFKNQTEALETIVFNNPSAIFFDLVFIKYQNNDTKKVAVVNGKQLKILIILCEY